MESNEGWGLTICVAIGCGGELRIVYVEGGDEAIWVEGWMIRPSG